MYFNTLETPYAFMILYLGKEIPSFDEIHSRMAQLLEAFKNKDGL